MAQSMTVRLIIYCVCPQHHNVVNSFCTSDKPAAVPFLAALIVRAIVRGTYPSVQLLLPDMSSKSGGCAS